MDLGLGYLTLDRSAATLSTGERQRMQLARAVRNRTTGVLYVLDEPSIGLHPSNIVGLTGVMHDLVADGNSVILVDHDTQILKEADWIVEMGPEAGANGGHVIAQGTIPAVEENPGVADRGRFSPARQRRSCATVPRRISCFQTAAFTCPLLKFTPSNRWRWISPRGGSPLSQACPAPARPRWCWKALFPRWRQA